MLSIEALAEAMRPAKPTWQHKNVLQKNAPHIRDRMAAQEKRFSCGTHGISWGRHPLTCYGQAERNMYGASLWDKCTGEPTMA